MRIRSYALIASVAVAVGGCGLKGPLYLPAAKTSAVKPPAPRPDTIVTPDPDRPQPAEAIPSPK
jgi:predicted small lipoprotein YifL